MKFNFKLFSKTSEYASNEALDAEKDSENILKHVERLSQRAEKVANEMEKNLTQNHFAERIRISMIGNDE